MFLVRLLFFPVRLVFYYSFGLLRFLGKPGARLIVSVLFLVLVFFARPVLHEAITEQLRLADPGLTVDSGVLDIVLFIIVAVVIVTYVVGSKLGSGHESAPSVRLGRTDGKLRRR